MSTPTIESVGPNLNIVGSLFQTGLVALLVQSAKLVLNQQLI